MENTSNKSPKKQGSTNCKIVKTQESEILGRQPGHWRTGEPEASGGRPGLVAGLKARADLEDDQEAEQKGGAALDDGQEGNHRCQTTREDDPEVDQTGKTSPKASGEDRTLQRFRPVSLNRHCTRVLKKTAELHAMLSYLFQMFCLICLLLKMKGKWRTMKTAKMSIMHWTTTNY